MNPQENIRDAAVRVARSFEGQSADPKSPRYEEYLQAIAPGETRRRAEEMSRMSGCALTVAAVWRAIGIDHPALNAPYRDQTAVSRLYQIALAANAVCSPYLGGLPKPGDVVLVQYPEHVYVVVEASEGLVLGIDGGQRDDHHFECVQAKEHVWTNLSERSRFPGGLLGMTRAINGWWDIESIAAFCLYGG
jgi:hypothetical protein